MPTVTSSWATGWMSAATAIGAPASIVRPAPSPVTMESDTVELRARIVAPSPAGSIAKLRPMLAQAFACPSNRLHVIPKRGDSSSEKCSLVPTHINSQRRPPSTRRSLVGENVSSAYAAV
jgi:hypothetical protein